MYRATRDFINARKQFTAPYVPEYLPSVRRIGGGQPELCYVNATDYMDRQVANGVETAMRSGWLVTPYDKKTNSSLIIQHWWNAVRGNGYVDTTPLDDTAEYVEDYALKKFCVSNDGKLKTHVAHSLLYKDGAFSLILDREIGELAKIEELRTEFLYARKWID